MEPPIEFESALDAYPVRLAHFEGPLDLLLSLARGWHYEAVDLGHAPDDAAAIEAHLTDGAARADVILTSGGASAPRTRRRSRPSP